MAADTVKDQNAAFCATAAHLLTELLRWIDPLHIDHSAAAVTDEVGVGFGGCVESLDTLDDSHGGDHALLLKCREVAVDRPQGEVGDLGLQLSIDPIGAGVRCRGTDTFQDCISLLAVLFHRRSHSF